MALQDDGRIVLVAFRGRFTDEHVTRLIDMGLETMLFTEVAQILDHLLLVLGRTGNGIDFGKLLKNACRFQITFVHLIMLFYLVF